MEYVFILRTLDLLCPCLHHKDVDKFKKKNLVGFKLFDLANLLYAEEKLLQTLNKKGTSEKACPLLNLCLNILCTQTDYWNS